MEPAWRQQGRGRGRAQEAQAAQVDRSRPPHREQEMARAPAGRGGRTAEPQCGEEGLWTSGHMRESHLTADWLSLVTDRCVQVRRDQEVKPGCGAATGREPLQQLLFRR